MVSRQRAGGRDAALLSKHSDTAGAVGETKRDSQGRAVWARGGRTGPPPVQTTKRFLSASGNRFIDHAVSRAFGSTRHKDVSRMAAS